MRTNCLDCLGRTNVTQTKIGMKICETILLRIRAGNRKVDLANGVNISMNETNVGQIFETVNNFWIENGDLLSR